MHVLLVISSHSPEIKWNAVRFGNFLLEAGEEVSIFLNGPSAALYEGDSALFPIKEQAKLFSLSEGNLRAWGKCMDIHGVNDTDYVMRSTMKELYALLQSADKVLSY